MSDESKIIGGDVPEPAIVSAVAAAMASLSVMFGQEVGDQRRMN